MNHMESAAPIAQFSDVKTDRSSGERSFQAIRIDREKGSDTLPRPHNSGISVDQDRSSVASTTSTRSSSPLSILRQSATPTTEIGPSHNVLRFRSEKMHLPN